MRWSNITEYDVVVVGGGPSGAATSLLLAREGLEVILLEKGAKKKHKPCGGVLPSVAPDTIQDILEEDIPEHVFEVPKELGLYYIPPSGVKNGGAVHNYSIHNIDRDRFDFWLRELAEESGVEIRYETKVNSVSIDGEKIRLSVANDKSGVTGQILVGADGVRSTVRRAVFPKLDAPIMVVGQEEWIASGDFGEFFYGFLHDDYSISYGYLIPKQDSLLIGLGVEPNKRPNYREALDIFQSMLAKEFSFKPERKLQREVWSIPFGFFCPGKDNVVLVGDAAGLCNPLSGEGIRLAIESAESASISISKGNQSKLIDWYKREIDGLAYMVDKLNDFVRSLDNKKREEFVSEELSRGF